MVHRLCPLMLGLILLFAGGCHCCRSTEGYCDCVDAFAEDPASCGDRWYRPKLDVSRWGMWNGPRRCRPGCR